MAATYTDIVDAMVEAEKRDLSTAKAVLTKESMDTFLADDDFSEADEIRQKESIGEEWTLRIEEGDDNYIVAEDGTQISL